MGFTWFSEHDIGTVMHRKDENGLPIKYRKLIIKAVNVDRFHVSYLTEDLATGVIQIYLVDELIEAPSDTKRRDYPQKEVTCDG